MPIEIFTFKFEIQNTEIAEIVAPGLVLAGSAELVRELRAERPEVLGSFPR